MTSAEEAHKTDAGQYIKAAVFGGLDGIITTFAVVASVTGANLPTGVVIVMVRCSRTVQMWARRSFASWLSPSSLKFPTFRLINTNTSGLRQPHCRRSVHGHGRVPLGQVRT
jgi:hypothetical protein